jgi:DNA-3-methyladenine glycosylase I
MSLVFKFQRGNDMPLVKKTKEPKIRCPWPKTELDILYHDKEWGRPVYEDQKLFEFLILEGAQAGLSWSTILKRREGYRAVFEEFDPEKIARYSTARIEKILKDERIIRNRLKVISAVKNAKAFLKIQKEYASFSDYLWEFVDNKPIINHWKSMSEIPNATVYSDRLSKALKQSGFNFVGSTICYAFMQAIGMVNDHLVDCFCRSKHC